MTALIVVPKPKPKPGSNSGILSAERVLQLRELGEQICQADEVIWREVRNCCRSLIRFGEAKALAGQKLLEARALCTQGQWMRFLECYCHGLPRTSAFRYMAFARIWPTVSDRIKRITNVTTMEPMEQLTLCRSLIRAAMLRHSDSKAAVGVPSPDELWPKDFLRWALWFEVHADDIEPDRLSLEQRTVLKTKLEPIVRLYSEL